MVVIKKDGRKEEYNRVRIKRACEKSSNRAMQKLTEQDFEKIYAFVENDLYDEIPVTEIHNLVEMALEETNSKVAKCYRDYRNYKQDFVHMLDKVYEKSQSIRYIGDRNNANTDSALVPTQRSLIYNELNGELYKKFFLNVEERQAMSEGYIYIHDRSARLDTMNCFDRSTKFITDRGVKSFYDFSDGDIVNVISHKGVWRKAVVHSYGWQKLQKVTFKRGNGKEKEILVTKNHRWFLKDGTETTELKIGDKLIYTPNITNFDFDELSKENQKLWCLGFGFADGSITDNHNTLTMTIRLCGEKNQFANRFQKSGYNVTYPKSLHGDGHIILGDIHSKELPYLQLNKDNILYFINGYLCADGNKNKEKYSSDFRGVQVTGDFNKFIYDLLNMAGYYVTNTTDLTGQKTNYGIREKKTISYQIYNDCGDRTWYVTNIEPYFLKPHAKVWCLEVEEDHSFLLENGIPTGNCCLFQIDKVLKDGFEMANIWYNEPKTLDVAFDVISDLAISAAACQYGGFTMPRIDTVLVPYAEKSYIKYVEEYKNIANKFQNNVSQEEIDKLADEYAEFKIRRDFEQGFQSWEYKFNTLGSSRGDYPFIAISFGIDESRWGMMASEICLKTRANGQGKKGFKKPVLFPKLTFLYDKNLHGEGKKMEWLFEVACECSSKTMYPDFLSLTGEGYIPSVYKKYGKVISLMGCRASLSIWYERGGMEPADENDIPVFEGRFNLGAISLHLPMILAKARQENKDFYEVLDYYLELVRKLHKKTYEFLAEKKASTNPLGYCQGGFYGGHLDPEDTIRSILPPMTMSFGITALNELQELYNEKSLVEDGEFALEVMKYINDKINQYKKEDHILYAIYGTPAEFLCGLQVEQFRKKYGIIKNVSSRPYVSNSFHCGVWEDIDTITKQNKESRFWNYFNGGKIQYCKYSVAYNLEAIKTLVRRGMELGFYEGVNLALSYCEECGYEELNMDVCPKCGSKLITKIDRMNGYLGFTRVKGKSRFNDAKNAEIKDRVSM